MWLDLAALEQRLNTRLLGRRLIYLTSTGSTQDVARGEAERDAAPGTAVIAEEQTAGRGRFGRSWVSPAGQNLYLTLLLRPPLERLRPLSIVAPLAVALAIEDETGLRPQIKWPNDVVMVGRKLSGVLIESELAGRKVRYSLVGIGVNVNFDIEESSEIAGIATSVKRELGRAVPREALLASLLNRFEALYDDPAPAFAQWRARLETLGRRITVRFRDQAYEGVAEDVDANGNLILRRPDGTALTIEAGEVTLRA
ncbi:MAG: biotin--[acetyl-CoA-carboxylase] ligase [Dehalococcoidia bacterium]|nr:biotin--[acetyl-CoA-carboxylase] ligase [Dehalococcoidia bacterium]